MTWTHLHLALNHIPVLGPFFVLPWLIIGWVRGSREIQNLSLIALLILSAAAIPIKFTGDFAYQELGTQPFLATPLVAQHEQSADQAATAVFLLGLLSVLALFLGRRGKPYPKWILASVLIVGFITGLMMARTANNGGQIRHEEIRGRVF